MEAAVRACLAETEALSLVKPGMKILVKPNLLRRVPPSACITTHPAVVKAVVRLLMEAGASVVIAESPGGPFSKAILRSLYDATGMTALAEETSAILSYDTDSAECYIGEGHQVKGLTLLNALRGCDAVVSVAKLKTHELMTYTGCVKNLFGLVPGVTKAETHYRLPGKPQFAHMLLDLCEKVKPLFSVLDGVWGMEGEGPSAGHPVAIGAILAGVNPHAVDDAAARLVGLDPAFIPTLVAARERGLLSEYQIKGFSDPLPLKRIQPPACVTTGKMPLFMNGLFQKWFATSPLIPERDCVGCGVCAANCPAKAITVIDGKAVIDRGLCINCFCCHELCPRGVVRIRRSVALQLGKSILH